MVKPLTIFAGVLLACISLNGCKRVPETGTLNDSLRLSPEQIARDERAAQAGDAQAAKRLWHHYDFVELDIQKGEMWRHRYESLTNATPPEK
jgi:hypothetical protein